MDNELLSLSDLVVGIDQFELGAQVAESSYATFHEAVDKRTGTKVVVKIQTYNNRNETELLMRELKFLGERHPLTVELVGCGHADGGENQVFMALKPAPYVTLKDALESERKGTAVDGWDATSKSKCVFGIAGAMCVVHSRNYLHRDLKPAAVQLDEHLEPVLGEFDLTREYNPEMTMMLGTPTFMAPELWIDDCGDKYDNKVDVFAFAVVLHRFFTDSTKLDDHPRLARSPAAWMLRVGMGARLARVEGIPDFYWDLITRCWSQDPGMRPSFQEIVALLHENTEKYIFPGADLAAVKEYESRIISTISQGQ